MFIKTTMPSDKRNQNSDLFFRQTDEVFGCLQLGVFNPKLGLFTAVKCDPVFRVCVNDPLSTHIPDIGTGTGTQGSGPQSLRPFSPAYQPPHCP
jgi:hypothetical protein